MADIQGREGYSNELGYRYQVFASGRRGLMRRSVRYGVDIFGLWV